MYNTSVPIFTIPLYSEIIKFSANGRNILKVLSILQGTESANSLNVSFRVTYTEQFVLIKHYEFVELQIRSNVLMKHSNSLTCVTYTPSN